MDRGSVPVETLSRHRGGGESEGGRGGEDKRWTAEESRYKRRACEVEDQERTEVKVTRVTRCHSVSDGVRVSLMPRRSVGDYHQVGDNRRDRRREGMTGDRQTRDKAEMRCETRRDPTRDPRRDGDERRRREALPEASLGDQRWSA